MHKAIKYIIHIVAAIFGSLAIIFAVASWRLSSGPISIAFLSPYLEEALATKDLNYRLEFEDTILTWSGWNRTLDILITDAHAVGPNGKTLASVPEISLELSAFELLRGVVKPTSVELLRPSVYLVRNPQGQIKFFVGTEFEGPDESVNALIEIFLSAHGADHPLGELKRTSVLGATLEMDDELLGLSWRSSETDLIFEFNDQSIDGDLIANVEIGETSFKVVATTSFERYDGKIKTKLRIGEMVPARLAGLSPNFAAFGGVDLPLFGDLEFTLDREGQLVERIAFDLTGGAGRINMPEFIPSPTTITNLKIRGQSDVNFRVLELAELAVETDGPAISYRGQLAGPLEDPGIHGTFEFKEMPFKNLKNFWPEFIMPNLRFWILENMLDGVITSFTAEIDLKQGEMELVKTGQRPDALDVKYEFSDATVSFLEGQPHAFGVDGKGHVDDGNMILHVSDGTIEDIYAPTGIAIVRDLMRDSAMITLIGHVEGPVENAVSLLDRPGFGYPSAMGMQSDQFGGHVVAELGVQMPFRRDARFEEAEFTAIAHLTDLSVNNLVGGRSLTNGDLRLALDQFNMEVVGKALIEGMPTSVQWLENYGSDSPYRSQYDIFALLDGEAQAQFGFQLTPYVKGPLDLRMTHTVFNDGMQHLSAALDGRQAAMEIPELFWQKPVGEEASILLLAKLQANQDIDITDFEFTSKEMRVKGSARIKPETGELMEAELHEILLGDNDVSVNYLRDDNNNLLQVTGKSLDIRPYIDQLLDSKQGNLPPFILETQVDRLITRADQQITSAQARVVNTAGRLESALLTGTLVTGSEFRLVIKPDGVKRRLTVRSDDAGSVARAFNIYDNAIGGELLMEAVLHDDEPGSSVSGEVRIDNYRVINAPTLAQLLAVASFTGIFDSLEGEGIAFSTFYLPFSLEDGVVTIVNAQTAGSAIGVNASGLVNLENQEVDVHGTIAPAYAINSILGNIPLIGDFLVGGEGEGVFAATYSITGTTEQPEIFVNPLSVLAPGFLRKLFSVFDGEVADKENEINPRSLEIEQ